MTDDRGVLGNLPRSRPGQRSEKRASPGERKERSGAGGRTAKTSAAAAGTRPPSSRPQPTPPGGADPVRGAIRGAAGLALTGAKVATGLTREVLRRLPRP
jgi:hypothetical protein